MESGLSTVILHVKVQLVRRSRRPAPRTTYCCIAVDELPDLTIPGHLTVYRYQL
jgi:hypothetical protein